MKNVFVLNSIDFCVKLIIIWKFLYLGWEVFNFLCFDENEFIDYSFLYKIVKYIKGYIYFGKYVLYGKGGYMM